MLRLIKQAFTWWNGQTISTMLYTRLFGQNIGQDVFGNKYYMSKTKAKKQRRWVIYNGEVEASRISAEWHGWLHKTWDEPPTEKPLPRKSWEICHKPNVTGSLASYKPSGSLKRKNLKERQDYEAWSPE